MSPVGAQALGFSDWAGSPARCSSGDPISWLRRYCHPPSAPARRDRGDPKHPPALRHRRPVPDVGFTPHGDTQWGWHALADDGVLVVRSPGMAAVAKSARPGRLRARQPQRMPTPDETSHIAREVMSAVPPSERPPRRWSPDPGGRCNWLGTRSPADSGLAPGIRDDVAGRDEGEDLPTGSSRRSNRSPSLATDASGRSRHERASPRRHRDGRGSRGRCVSPHARTQRGGGG